MALLALTIQFIASFGHVHREDLFGSRQSVAVADAGNPASDADADRHEGELCGVCWAAQLLGHAQVAIPPLPCAVVFARASIRIPPPTPVALPECRAFQSRAPPT